MFRELSGSYAGKIKFVKVNVDEFPQIAKNYGVMNLPTIKFFCAGRAIGELVGYLSAEPLRAELDKVLTVHKACLEQSSPMRQ